MPFKAVYTDLVTELDWHMLGWESRQIKRCWMDKASAADFQPTNINDATVTDRSLPFSEKLEVASRITSG
jgi:hypothetical protein